MTAGLAVDPPPARRVVHLLLGHTLVDEARRALRLVLRVVPPARPSAARSGAVGAPAGAERAAAVGWASGAGEIPMAGRGRRILP